MRTLLEHTRYSSLFCILQTNAVHLPTPGYPQLPITTQHQTSPPHHRFFQTLKSRPYSYSHPSQRKPHHVATTWQPRIPTPPHQGEQYPCPENWPRTSQHSSQNDIMAGGCSRLDKIIASSRTTQAGRGSVAGASLYQPLL